jgi:hypothetical protein
LNGRHKDQLVKKECEPFAQGTMIGAICYLTCRKLMLSLKSPEPCRTPGLSQRDARTKRSCVSSTFLFLRFEKRWPRCRDPVRLDAAPNPMRRPLLRPSGAPRQDAFTGSTPAAMFEISDAKLAQADPYEVTASVRVRCTARLRPQSVGLFDARGKAPRVALD